MRRANPFAVNICVTGGVHYAAGQPRPSKGSLYALLVFCGVTATTFFAPLAFWRRRGREGKAAC